MPAPVNPINVPNGAVPPAPPVPQAGGNAETTAPKAPKAGGGATISLRDELVNKARESGLLSDERRENFGSKAETLEFIQALGFSSISSTYTDRQGVAHDCSGVVGAIFKSTEPIKVPRLPMSTSVQTGINVEEITYEEVPAGQEFEVTLMEAAVLLTQEEYSARFMYAGELRGQFAAKFKSVGAKQKFPTPHFLIKDYQYKAHSKNIDVEQSDGSYTVIPGYERYQELLNKPRSTRGSSGKRGSALQNSDKTAVALRQFMFHQ